MSPRLLLPLLKKAPTYEGGLVGLSLSRQEGLLGAESEAGGELRVSERRRCIGGAEFSGEVVVARRRRLRLGCCND